MVAYLKKLEGSKGFHQIVDFLNASHIQYALTENPTIYVSLIQQFWQTATASTLNNGEIEITATIDGKVKIVTEASIRRHLKLEDYDGSTVLVESHHTPTGAPSTSPPQLSPTLKSSIRHETKVPQPSSPPHTNVVDEVTSTRVDVRHGGAATIVTNLDAGQGSVESLETDLKQTKQIFGTAFTKLIKKVKKLKKTFKTSQARRKARIVVSDDEEDLEDPSKQGRKIAEIDQDHDISLVQHDVEVQGRHEHAMEEFTTAKEVYTAEKEVSTAEPVSTAGASVSTASVSTASPPRVSAAKSLVYIRRSATKTKDKGKGIMEESESAITKAKRQQEQERLGLETAVRLQEEFDEEERQRIARIHEEASSFNFEE
ncbi:hypothetical protein Tco_0474758 [Tanacetum coccineum]